MARSQAPISLPRDQFPHTGSGEWWYWNGLLQTKTGKRFAFMHCLFRVNPAKARLPGQSWLDKNIFFSHVLWVDLQSHRRITSFGTHPFLQEESFTGPLLNYAWSHTLRRHSTDTTVTEVSPLNFHMQNKIFDLQARATKLPLLMGGQGVGKWCGSQVYYYSLPRLRLTGLVQIGDRSEKVTGLGWHDHQWATLCFQSFHWTWFSLHLTGKRDLMVVEYLEGQKHHFLASMSDGQGKAHHSKRVQFKPVGKPWISLKTHAHYQLDWEIEVPEFGLRLKIQPQVRSQEMLFSLLKYWEGPIIATGMLKGRPVKGEGFCELV